MIINTGYSKKIVVLCLFLIAYCLVFLKLTQQTETEDPNMVSDVGGLMPTRVEKVVKGQEELKLVDIVNDAAEKDMKISIAGKMHSQGGHTYYPGSVVLDMTGYNKVLDLDVEKKTIRVQSGATWEDVQEAANQYGLAVKVMQSQNIFTIGGSLSVNVHGRDIRHGSLIETVNSFRLLKQNGDIINVSRTVNEEYFPLVIGGYGLFGVILDAEIQLTDDELYSMKTTKLPYDQYSEFFKKEVRGNQDVKMHLARISTAPDTFLKDMYITDYVQTEDQEAFKEYSELKGEEGTFVSKFMLGVSRKTDWGKNLFWDMQETYFTGKDGGRITRNNAMRSESKFMEYESSKDTDVLQEYFVPVDEFTSYIDDMREALKGEDLNLINITIRYVEENEDAVLSYAKEDMFALVLLINQKKSIDGEAETERVIRKMLDVTLNHNGSYYLPYYSYPSRKQMNAAYPRTQEFFESKRRLDPEEIFMNHFYEVYGK
ncbi:FAD-binding oxidoreductase [Bacillus salacetis]|uniref:FAD-binding oxidoreductase n=1 Tax=Bacillus salacetis TaxID=2315464 RepID=A0A3A1QV31_9BACI|nr:FAD-binding oxidoreductase [Bacillus salacetis]RIW29268.1 FAD-binding oxidoreductase [Bacillus salacetis]